jgi:hypothetical protein
MKAGHVDEMAGMIEEDEIPSMQLTIEFDSA